MIEIFLDKNLSEYVADALNSLNKGYFTDCSVFSTKREIGKGETDEKIIPEIGKRDGVLISRDLNIFRTQEQYKLSQTHNLGIFFISLPKKQNKHWDMVKVLINNWEDIIEKTKSLYKPYAFRIPIRGNIQKM